MTHTKLSDPAIHEELGTRQKGAPNKGVARLVKLMKRDAAVIRNMATKPERRRQTTRQAGYNQHSDR